MSIIIPFAGAGALLEATGSTLEKTVLRKRKINFRDFIVWHFLTIILVMIPFLLFFWNMAPEAFLLKNILILAGVIISSVLANIFMFYSLKWENLTTLEPARLFQPLFVVLLALIFYVSERQTQSGVLIAAFIASLALVISSIKKHHLQLNKYIVAALLGSFFFALELVISRAILPFYNPLTFYFVRCSLVFLAVLAIFRSKPSYIDKKSWKLLWMIGAVWAAYRSLLYFGFLNFGVIFTTLIFILAHVFIYIFARIFLKEKFTLRNIISAIIIIACVAYAISIA